MSGYELWSSPVGPARSTRRSIGSVRSMLNKGLARLRVRPAEIGKALSGALAGCRELKFRADGLRVIYRIRDGQVQIVDILAIGARDHDRAFRDAERRLGDEG